MDSMTAPSRPVRRDTEHTLGLIHPHLREGDTVLDVGCGSAYVAATLALSHPGSYGIDVVDARKAPLETFALYDGITVPFADASFDVSVLAFVLHHVPNEAKPRLVREVARVTRRTVVIVEDTPRNALDRLLSNRHGEAFRRSIGSSAGFGFYSHDEWLDFFAREKLAVVENRPLSRLCRDWKQPYARSVFAVSVESRATLTASAEQRAFAAAVAAQAEL